MSTTQICLVFVHPVFGCSVFRCSHYYLIDAFVWSGMHKQIQNKHIYVFRKINCCPLFKPQENEKEIERNENEKQRGRNR